MKIVLFAFSFLLIQRICGVVEPKNLFGSGKSNIYNSNKSKGRESLTNNLANIQD